VHGKTRAKSGAERPGDSRNRQRRQETGKTKVVGENDNNEFDSPWKKIIEDLFPDFLKMFFPGVYKFVNWSVKPESQDNALPRSMRRALGGTQVVDKVMKVHTLDERVAIIYVHIEVQAQRDEKFPKRMFDYNVRLSEKFKHDVLHVPYGDLAHELSFTQALCAAGGITGGGL
jgi:hypothetical protein